jgi:hypothetical protein
LRIALRRIGTPGAAARISTLAPRTCCAASAYHAVGGVRRRPIAQRAHRMRASQNSRNTLMTLSMYQASVPVLVRGLTNLKAILGKAEAHAAQKQVEPSVFVNSRLFPDMLPLNRQVHIATDTAKGCAARLAGVEAPKFEDVEVTFDELCARIDKTIAYLNEFTAAQIDGTEEREIVLKMRTGPIQFTGVNYLLYFVLPNFYFHLTTAYDILRHNGVEIGKFDFLGKAG